MKYELKRFLLMTLDPVHVGTGGNRLGRVDLSIVREPGTRLPKIPGTSLNGALRQYAAYQYESLQCAGAGQAKDEKKGHCRQKDCPVCYTFGYLSGTDGGQSGTVNIGDARLLLFPVYSLAGPIWLTSPSILRQFGAAETVTGDEVMVAATLQAHQHLNLGWLMLPVTAQELQLPDTLKHIPDDIRQRSVLVSDKLFSQIVNSNLEVRTSVNIDPETGAPSDKGLFTYEAIPRAAVLFADVIEDDYRHQFVSTNQTKLSKSLPQRATWERPLDVVQAGFDLAEYLGIGGMGTRGFGRIRLLEEVK
jgi:CRISPR-associated protein Cmr4